MSKQKILLVDDEPDILEIIGFNLEREGYEVFTAPNGKKALEIARKQKPDLVLLDVMMPEMDGMDTCRELREDPNLKETLIAFLTARNEDYSQIAGFDAGADDYISKPIKPRVLVSRVKALLRRQSVPEAPVTKPNLTGIVIDKERYVVFKHGVELSLPKKEFELLALLASQPGRVFTRESILSNVWGNDVIVGDRTIDVHIRKLREKLGDDFFKTIKGVGYKFEP
jgi:two-component system alkaline phosphatase synthesis response regulator PhoP